MEDHIISGNCLARRCIAGSNGVCLMKLPNLRVKLKALVSTFVIGNGHGTVPENVLNSSIVGAVIVRPENWDSCTNTNMRAIPIGV